VRAGLTRAGLGPAIEQVRRHGGTGLLATRFVNPQLAQELRQADTQFADCAGNAFLRGAGLLIFTTGNRPREPLPRAPARPLRPAGAQVVFALLCNPGLERAPYREIAAKAGVALGTIAGVVGDLVAAGYVEHGRGHVRRLVRKENLLDRWVTAYVEQLRPKLLLERYRAAADDWWKDAHPGDGLWGGEVAAWLKTGFLRPQAATLYGERIAPEAIIKHRLTRDPAGNVELLRRFWGFEYTDPKGPLVHPILAYADLLADPGKRTREAAEILREQHIAGYLRQD